MQWLDELYAAYENESKEQVAALRDGLFNTLVRELCPTEQMWIVRIILHDLHIAANHERVCWPTMLIDLLTASLVFVLCN